MEDVSLDAALKVSSDVVFRELDGEAIVLNLATGVYFGLDPVGTRMWEVLGTNGTVESAYDALLAEFDVEPEQLRRDLYELIEKLREHGLLEINDE